MTQKILSLGFDTERPYGEFAIGPQASDLRRRQLDFVRKINRVYDSEGAARTFFILGQYLYSCLKDVDESTLRAIYDHDNPLIEVQQHSYSHPIFREIQDRPDKPVLPSGDHGKR